MAGGARDGPEERPPAVEGEQESEQDPMRRPTLQIRDRRVTSFLTAADSSNDLEGRPHTMERRQESEPDPERSRTIIRERHATKFLKIYNFIFRIRLMAYSVMCLAYLVTLCVGGFVQELVRPSMLQSWQWYTGFVSFYVFPVLFCTLALWVEGANDLFLDALSNPCLYHLRKVFRSVGPGIPLAVQDLVIVSIFEAVPILSGLIEPIVGRASMSRGPIVPIAIYVRGGVLATLLLALLALLARVLQKFGYCDKSTFGIPIQQLGMAWRDLHFGSADDFDGARTVSSHWVSDLNTFDAVEDLRNLRELKPRRVFVNWGISHLLILVVAAAFEMFMRTRIGWRHDEDEEIEDWVLILGMLIIIAVLSLDYVYVRYFKKGVVAGCGYFMCLMLVTGFTLLSLWLRAVEFEAADNTLGIFSPPAGNSTALRWAPPPASRYPICSTRWGHDNVTEQLTIMDLALFAEAVYRGDRHLVTETMESYTRGTSLEGTRLVDYVPSQLAGAWSVFEVPRLKMRVVAVRGTQKSSDILLNLNLYAKIVLMQAFKFVVPMFEILPLWSIRTVISEFSIPEKFGSTAVWAPLMEATRKWKDKDDGYGMLLTGHSLGGILSAIVGGHLQIPAVAFSAPGEFYSMDKFGLTEEQVLHSVVNVIPMHDLIPQIDFQAGMCQQHIECSETGMGALLSCHKLRRTICELYRGCGDSRGRTYASDKYLLSQRCVA